MIADKRLISFWRENSWLILVPCSSLSTHCFSLRTLSALWALIVPLLRSLFYFPVFVGAAISHGTKRSIDALFRRLNGAYTMREHEEEVGVTRGSSRKAATRIRNRQQTHSQGKVPSNRRVSVCVCVCVGRRGRVECRCWYLCVAFVGLDDIEANGDADTTIVTHR